MRFVFLALCVIALTGCSRIAEHTDWRPPPHPDGSATLHKIRIEQSDATRFSGLLALEPRKDGMWCVLLDATGIPLVKGLVSPDGTMRMEYCADAVRSGRLPDLLSQIIEYAYFIPASSECPWYDPYRVCFSQDEAGNSLTWRKIGPFRSWQVSRQSHGNQGDTITVRFNMVSVLITLQPLAEEPAN